MYKPASLRAFLTAANPELAQDPDRLVVFIDAGNLRATYEPALSFEYAYVLNLVFTDYAGHPDAIMVPLLIWLRTHQSELLANFDNHGKVEFEADVLANDKVDLSIKIPLTERVGVKPRAGGGYNAEHYPEPTVEEPYFAERWQLFVNGELIASWDPPPPPGQVPAPPAGGMVVVLATVPTNAARAVQFAHDTSNVLWRYTDQSEWQVLYALSDVVGSPGTPVELQVGATHLQWRYVGESDWRDLVSIADLANQIGVESWAENNW